MNQFIGSLAIVTTQTYHSYKIGITITHNQLTVWLIAHNEHYRLPLTATSQLLNLQIYNESPLCRLDMDCIGNTFSDVILEAMFIVQLPSNKKLQWCIHYCCPHLWLRECLPSYCLAMVWSDRYSMFFSSLLSFVSFSYCPEANTG
jgi:hypothetical protein